MIVGIDCDEKYPFYEIWKPETLIGGTANNSMGNPPSSWKLETVDDVLKMTWLSFFDIPQDKYDWIKRVYDELEKVNEYLGGLTEEDKVK